MNNLEKKMVDILLDLKENYHVLSVKTEFETEGTRFEEALRLKEIVTRAGLNLTIKIGGCEALKDMYDAKAIGVDAIVAPMIESPYAAKKYLQAMKIVFSEEERNDMKVLINIETKYGLNYIEEILISEFAKDLNGIIMGRTDMISSLGMSKQDINHDVILEYAQLIAQKTLQYHKIMGIGGGISIDSLPFLRKISKEALNNFETRKIIFDAQKALKDKNIHTGISKAIEFELMWLKNKQNKYKIISTEDDNRITTLESIYNDK